MAGTAVLPNGRHTTVQHKSSVFDQSTSGSVSETVWLQPQPSSASTAAAAASGPATTERGRRPKTLPIQQQQLQQNVMHKPRAPDVADRLAETAKSADLKALIRYVGHQQKSFHAPYESGGIVESAGAFMDGHVLALQSCIRHAARRLTHFINSVYEVVSIVNCGSDASGGRDQLQAFDDRDTHAVAGLCRRLHAQCRIVSDDVLPSLVEALRASVSPLTFADDRLALTVKWDLVDATFDALQPCTQMVFVARQLLDVITDVEVVADMTTRVLSVAEALQRLRAAANQSMSELMVVTTGCSFANDVRYPFEPRDFGRFKPEETRTSPSADVVGAGNNAAAVASASDMALNLYRGYASDVRLPLASMEICDAAYRQIQRAGESLDYCYWPPPDTDEHTTNLLTTIVASCCEIGSSMEALSKAAERGQMQLFHQAVRNFADAICRVMVSIAQVGLTERKMVLTSKAIRHCSSSLITSARLIVADRQHPVSYKVFAAHSRALSRALTELVNHLSSLFNGKP